MKKTSSNAVKTKHKCGRKKGGKGSLTVMAALSFWLIAQLLFTLAEGCRQIELKKTAQMTSDAAVESLMADYCRPMWEDYSLLCYDAGGTDSKISTTKMASAMESTITADFTMDSSLLGLKYTNLLTLSCDNICFDSYTLLTDGNGSAYIKSAAAYMQQNLIIETAMAAYNNYDSITAMKKNSSFNFGSISAILKKLQQGKAEAAVNTCPGILQTESTAATGAAASAESSVSIASTASTASSASADTSSNTSEDALQQAVQSSKSALLDQVLPSGRTVSSKKVTSSGLVSNRTLEQGVSPVTGSISVSDRAFMEAYLLLNLTDFTDLTADDSGISAQSQTEKTRALDYQLEYVLAGKDSDAENLKAAVTEILVIREAANMLYLQTSSVRKSELKAAALALSSAVMLPQLEKGVEIGLMAAWAYAESLMDLRTLLSGSRIPLIKSNETWTSKLSNLKSILSGKAKAKSVNTGLNYQEYLGILLLGKSNSALAYRTMDMQEASIRSMSSYEDFRMDHAICSVKAAFTYSDTPIFFSFVDLISTGKSSFTIKSTSEFSFRGS